MAPLTPLGRVDALAVPAPPMPRGRTDLPSPLWGEGTARPEPGGGKGDGKAFQAHLLHRNAQRI
jgi:hypothetical protein